MHQQDFERLYEEHAQPLFGFLLYRTGTRALAEDVAADTFERVLRAQRRFDPRKASQKTWIYSIALNVLRDHLRRQAAEVRALQRAGPASADPDTDPLLAGVENRDNLEHALATLSAEERETIALRYGAELSAPEISKLIGEPLTTVEGRLYRGLRKLRDRLEA
jgi:RNA polymerase sigma factor (sigma-70 family)